MLIGAHVPARGGIRNAVDWGLAIGAEVIQTHPTPAQMWRPLRLEEPERRLYLDHYAASGLGGHYLHAVYLINLASPKEALLRSSVDSLVHYMELAHALDADGVVFHPGSHLGAGFDAVLPQIGAALREVVERSPAGRAALLVENSAGAGGGVGRDFEEIARILEAAGSERVGVCLDTQHAYAAGHDLRSADGVARTLAELARVIGFDRLSLVHANDSGSGLGSRSDRHANIGRGEIAEAGFRLLLSDPRLRRVPWVLEVPGPERQGPDRSQVDLLRELAGLEPSRPTPAGDAEAPPAAAVRRRGRRHPPAGGAGGEGSEPPGGASGAERGASGTGPGGPVPGGPIPGGQGEGGVVAAGAPGDSSTTS
jgi:deoxyribonuclease-4